MKKKDLQEVLDSIPYLISIEKNLITNLFEIKIGLPKKWFFCNDENIGYEIIASNTNGELIKIFSKNESITIDDLIAFIKVIIETNEKILEKEKKFMEEEEMKLKELEKKKAEFYQEINELKEKSFKKTLDKENKIEKNIIDEK